MGTDIHPAIEYRADEHSPWKAHLQKDPDFGKYDYCKKEYTASINIDRDYDLFAILGNVRNGFGFAGVPTGEGFSPVLSSQRGVPVDISEEAAEALSGEHSATWVSLQEILDYDWTKTSTHTGVMRGTDYKEYLQYRAWHPTPKSYAGGIAGPKIVQITEEQMQAFINADVPDLENYIVSIQWQDGNYANDAVQLWTKLVPIMLNYGREYGYSNVRLVMDFDS